MKVLAIKQVMQRHQRYLLVRILCTVFCLAWPNILGLHAAPTGGVVVEGEAQLIESTQSFDILQASERAVIEYEQFNIAEGEVVNFVQPSSEAVALNRVVGGNLSEIHGQLNANGHVYLINPHGIMFGGSSLIDVNGLLATTLELDNQAFMQGQTLHLVGGEETGQITNNGLIQASEEVLVVADQITNTGEIYAQHGEVILQSSDAVWLQPIGSEIPMLIEDQDFSAGKIENSGYINARDIHLGVSSQVSQDETVILNTGVLGSGVNDETAQDSVTITESISLVSNSGDIVNSGAITAESSEIRAERVAHFGDIAAKNADGSGGLVDINAEQMIVIANGSRIDASADAIGNGGSVTVYSPNTTVFEADAEISARGGEQSGGGGFVEVSGIQHVDVQGKVDIGAPQGDVGLFYIDPIDITIADAGTDNTFTDNMMGGFNWDAVAANVSATISPLAITTALQTGNVEIDASVGSGGAGNISIASRIDLSGGLVGATLRFNAPGEIRFLEDTISPIPVHGALVDEDGTGTPENLNIELIAGGDIVMEANTQIQVEINGVADQFDILLQSGNDVIMVGNASIDAGIGEVDIHATRDVELGLIESDKVPPNPLDYIIDVSAQGRIYDANAEATNIIANDGLVRLVANSGINENSLPLETEIARLSVSNASNGAINIENSRDLEIVDVISAGDITLELPNAANLVISDASTNFDANTVFDLNGGGILEILSDGLTSAGSLFIDAGTIQDNLGSSNVSLTATNANINLSAAVDDAVLTTSFNNVTSLNISGAQRFTVVDEDSIRFDLLEWTNELTLQSATGELFVSNLTAAPAINRHLNLITQADSNVTLPDPGIDITGNLSITSGGVSTPSPNPINLLANSVVLDLQNLTQPLNLSTTVNNLSLTTNGNDVDVNENTSLVLDSVNVNGSLTVMTNDDLSLGMSAPSVTGAITLQAQGDINLANGQLDVSSSNLTMAAASLNFVPQAGVPNILADTLDLQLSNIVGNLDVLTSVNTMAVDVSGADSFSLQNDQDLVLSEWSSDAIADVVLGVSGSLTLPASGLTFSEQLSLSAEELIGLPPDAQSLVGSELVLNIDNPSTDLQLGLAVDNLDLKFGHASNVQTMALSDGDGLILSDLDGDGFAAEVLGGELQLGVSGNLVVSDALNFSNSNFAAEISAGDLIVDADITAVDDRLDGVRTALIDLSVNGGDIILGRSTNTTISSTNLVEPTLQSSLGVPLLDNGESYTAISLKLNDVVSAARTITLGDSASVGAGVENNLMLSAVGGDIDIDTGAGLVQLSEAERSLVQYPNAQITVSNDGEASEAGFVVVNGTVDPNPVRRFASDGRVINIIDDSQVSVPPEILTTTDFEHSAEIIEPEVKVGANASKQFDLLYGACDEMTADGRSRCELQLAIKAFLSHWLVGGELPPRVDE